MVMTMITMLDSLGRQDLLEHLRVLNKQNGITIIFINSETPTSLSGCSLFYFGWGRLPHRSLDVQL